MYSVRTPCEAMSLTAAAGSSQARESYMSTHVPRPRYAVMEAEPAAADACGRAAPTRPMRTVSPAMRSRRPGLLSEYGRVWDLSLIHISEPTRLGMISYAVFCLKK